MYAFAQSFNLFLAKETATFNTNFTGKTCKMGTQAPSGAFKVVTKIVVANGANNPTAQIVLESSADGSTWVTVGLGTSRTAPGTYIEVLDPQGAYLLTYFRVNVKLQGGTNFDVTSFTAQLVGDAPFTLSEK